jgi:required for meiotic nuclear division protein 1
MNTYLIQARHVSTQLRLKNLAPRFQSTPIVESTREVGLRLAPYSYVFIYNYGSVVFFNVADEARQSILLKINESSEAADISKVPVIEDFAVEDVGTAELQYFHEIGFNKIRLKDLTEAKIRFICGVVAESAALDYFEQTVEDMLIKSQQISRNLKQTGDPRMSMNEMVKYVGVCLNTKQEIIADLYVIDSPDETWDDQVLARLYEDLKNLFEIETRYKVLEYKLQLIQDTVDVIVELLRFRKQTTMEFTIIILIAIEVFWFLVKVFFPGKVP